MIEDDITRNPLTPAPQLQLGIVLVLERGRALREGYGFHTGPKNPIMALISEYMLTADRLICTHARYNS